MNPDDLTTLIVPGTDPDVAERYATLAERARETVFGFEDEVCIVDVETTGFTAERDRLIEVAGAIMRGPEVVEAWSTLVDPGIAIPVEITRLTGIDSTMTRGMPAPDEAADALARFAGGRPLVAHHAAFDRAFLAAAAGTTAFSDTWYDTLALARIALPRLRSHRLSDLAQAFAPDLAERAHRAADDVATLCRIWRVALTGLSDVDPGLLQRIAELGRAVTWPERSLLAHIAAAAPKATYDLKALRRARVAADKRGEFEDAAVMDCTYPLAEQVTRELSAEGVAGRMYEGFEQRDVQVEMARAVGDAFASGTHLAVEAGTGVGKSLAYLVPAAITAQINEIGVGVATKTNALMDQLVYHELPRLARALPGELRYCSLKGYDHYLCLRKLERFASTLDEADGTEGIETAALLLSWVGQSSWGDLDIVNVHWDRGRRAAIQSSHADCTFKRCRYYPNQCYLHGIRRRAASSHIVVTNHALLFRDVVAQGGILPPIRHWVIDEAHSAEGEARKQLRMDAGYAELSSTLDALGSSRGGTLETLRRKVAGAVSDEELEPLLTRMREEVVRAGVLTASTFEYVKDLSAKADDSDYDSADVWVSAGVRDSGSWGTVASTGRSLAKRLEEIIRLGRDAMTRLEAAGPDYVDARADLAGHLSRVAEQCAALEAVINGDDPSLVYSATLDRRPNVRAEHLTASRLDIGEVLAEDLYPRARSVVFTSATIAVGESFDHFLRAVGLDRADPEQRRTLRLSSSYDFDRQMDVYVISDIEAPNAPRYLAEMEDVLVDAHVAMGGSVLTLFTNRRDMERLYARVEPRLREVGLDVVMQRRGTSAKRLRDDFIADATLSLFALRSFWEGFDAKGDTLRCVIVPKLPFGRPNDPLARERDLREGRAAWSRYSLPEAVIDLKQAAGRLIRSSTDEGCLVLADARVASMSYGREFLGALPSQSTRRVGRAELADAMRARFGG